LKTAKSAPKTIYDSFIFIMAVFAFFGVREVVNKIKEHRKKWPAQCLLIPSN